MVSAVFECHPAPQAGGRGQARGGARHRSAAAPARAARTPRDPIDWRGLLGRVLPPLAGMALLVAIWGCDQKGGRFPRRATLSDKQGRLVSHTGRHLRSRGEAVRPPVLREGPERPGHRLEHPVLAAARGARLRPGGPRRHPAGFHDRPLRRAQPHGLAADQPAQAGVAAGLAADRPAGLQGGQPGGHLDHLHLLDLADGHQHRGRRAARARGLPQRGTRAQAQRVEDRHAHPAALGACPTC